MALTPETHTERTGRAPVGRVAWRSGFDRAERVANPVFLKNYEGFLKLVGLDPKADLVPEKRPAWVSKLPGPLNDPNFPGDVETIFKYWLESNFHGDNHMMIKEWSQQYGNERNNYVVPMNLQGYGRKPHVGYALIICNPEDHMRLSREHIRKSTTYDGPRWSHHFLNQYDVNEWRKQRTHMLQPMVPQKVFGTMLPTMESTARELIERIRDGEGATMFFGQDRPEPSYNLSELLSDAAFRVLCRTLFGEEDSFIKANSQRIRWGFANTFESKGSKIIDEWCTAVHARAQQKLENDESSSLLAESGPVLREVLAADDDEVYRLNHITTPHGGKGAKTSREKMIKDNIAILTLAGHDTTASTMAFCLMELARNPQVQKKVQAEADQIFASLQGQNITYKEFPKMVDLTKCINETLRLWNAVSYGSRRELMYDEKILGPDGEYVVVPAGTTFLVPNYAPHRSKHMWGEDAEVWNPERFAGFADPDGTSINFQDDQSKEKPVQYSTRNPESKRFHPFAHGPRDCYGKNFAQAEMRVILAHLLHEFDFALAEPSKSLVAQNAEQIGFDIMGILKARDGLWMHVTPRQKQSKL